MAVQGFYWLRKGELAGCGRPGGPGAERAQRRAPAPPDASVARLADDLAWLKAQGITALLSLTEAALDPGPVEREAFAYGHLPVDDLAAPTPPQFQDALSFVDWQRALGRAVAVHCRMGQGRTGAILAAYLIRDGLPPAAAIARLRALSPGALSSPAQERALHAYAARRDWVL